MLKGFFKIVAISLVSCFISFLPQTSFADTAPDPGINTSWANGCWEYGSTGYLGYSCLSAQPGFWKSDDNHYFSNWGDVVQYVFNYYNAHAVPELQSPSLVLQDSPQVASNTSYTPNTVTHPMITNIVGLVNTNPTAPDYEPTVLGSATYYGTCPASNLFAVRATAANSAYPEMSEGFCVNTVTVRNSCPDGTCGLNSVDIPNQTQYTSSPSVTVPGASSINVGQIYNSATGQWTLNADKSVNTTSFAGNTFANVQDSMGRIDRYTYNTTTGQWSSTSPAVTAALSNLYDGNNNLTGYKIVSANNTTETYDLNGHIVARQPLGQGTTTYTRDSLGRLSNIATPNSQNVVINYKYNNTTPTQPADYAANQVIDNIVLPNSQTISYSENSSHENTGMTLPDGTGQQFTYNGTANRMDTITDLSNNILQSTSYDSNGLVTQTGNFGGQNAMQYNNSGTGSVSSTDANNNYTNFNVSNIAGNNQTTGLTALCPTCSGIQGNNTQYDSFGNPISITDYNGNITHIAYTTPRNLITGITQAYGTTLARTKSFQWSPTWNIPTQITEPVAGGSRVTGLLYDVNGNLQAKNITAPKNDGSGNSETRNSLYNFNNLGQLTSYTDAKSHTTTYNYDSITHNLTSMTNALSQTTSYSDYTALNKPQTITFPSGLVATLSYDATGKILSSTLNHTETTTYGYDSNGNLNKITYPDGAYLVSLNNPNGLVQATQHYASDNTLLGEMDYTYDKMSNIKSVKRLWPTGSTAYLLNKNYNSLNLLSQDVNSFNAPTQYTYDSNGQQTQFVDQVSNITKNKYDALNRLIQVTYPDTSLAKYTYDAGSRVNQITDGKSVSTQYTYNGFDNLIKAVSQDSGTTQYTYDLNGNVATRTDARGTVATYSYDNLDRLTGVSYNTTPVSTVTMTYDTCQVGRICTITDKTGTINYNYDIYGNVINKTQTVNNSGAAKTFTVQYGYNTSNQLTSLTLPSGNIEYFSYYGHRVNQIDVKIGTNANVNLLNNVDYYPLGPVFDFTYGNNATHECDMDTNFYMSAIQDSSAPVVARTYNANPDGTIDSIVDNSSTNDSYGYDYDNMTRITGYESSLTGNTVQNYTYDSNSNRKTKKFTGTTGATTTYNYTSGKNRLASLSGAEVKSFGYDAMGDMTSDGTYTYTYDEAARMKSATSTTNTITYQVNYIGQRISKTVNGVTTYFNYDENNQLIGEYDQNGNAVKEHIYLQGMPVGLISSGNLYYVHPDHLGSPRTITDSSNNVLWTWANDSPFGDNLPTETGISTYNLRFPGQYFDNETKLNYNLNRDYNSNTGRYVQTDPIGLNGGLNLYNYAAGNSLINFDSSGLFKIFGIEFEYNQFWANGFKIPSKWTPSNPQTTCNYIDKAFKEGSIYRDDPRYKYDLSYVDAEHYFFSEQSVNEYPSFAALEAPYIPLYTLFKIVSPILPANTSPPHWSEITYGLKGVNNALGEINYRK